MPKLNVHYQGIDQQYNLAERTRIGRVLDNEIYLKDPNVSRLHAEIIRTDDGYLFKDLTSRNGSYLKDARISEVQLGNGDEIQLGKTTLTFIEEPGSDVPVEQVRISSKPVSDDAIQARISADSKDEFVPAYLIRDDMEWRDDYEKLRLGYEMMKYVQLNRDLTDTLAAIATKFIDIFPADRCAIVLLDAESDRLMPTVIKAKEGAPAQMTIPESILEEGRQHHTAMLVADSRSDERVAHSASILVQGLTSILCAPIVYNNRFFGAVYLDSQKSAMVFSSKDLQLLTSLSVNIATLIANTLLLQTVEHEARDKVQLERLLPPAVIEKVASGEVRIEKRGGELKDPTIMFADIRNFTNMAHHATPSEVVEMLNEYFELIVSIVFQYGGTVDKFIGDEVMVLFDAITDVEYPEDRAVRCAFHMHGAVELFNMERQKEGKKEIRIGVGINTGQVLVGAIGSNQALQYTCIGDAVNIASRLTSSAKAGQTVISDSTFHRLKVKPRFDRLPSIKLKGIDRPVQIYSVWEKITDTTRRDL